MRTLLPALLFFVACGPPTDERALRVLEEGLTVVPPEDECLIDPAVMCCDDLIVTRIEDAPQHFDLSENDLGGLGRTEEVNFAEETLVVAYTSSCPGSNASLRTIDLRIVDDTVAILTYDIVTDEGDGTEDAVRPYSVVTIARPPAEITELRYEIVLPSEEG
ncbi:MAG: hypothetical protein EP330_03940 [Deltaproteobacteria bacterium]|nr:MAG: hypothetical protein EP330_03940 [Deltaproteobacteria bacterium]